MRAFVDQLTGAGLQLQASFCDEADDCYAFYLVRHGGPENAGTTSSQVRPQGRKTAFPR
jgi:hypothetical protein